MSIPAPSSDALIPVPPVSPPSLTHRQLSERRGSHLIWIMAGSAALGVLTLAGILVFVLLNSLGSGTKDDVAHTKDSANQDVDVLPETTGGNGQGAGQDRISNYPSSAAVAPPQGKTPKGQGNGMLPPLVGKEQGEPVAGPGGGGRLPDIEVQFLGSVGKGTRFVIIADRSGSMNAPVRVFDAFTQNYNQRRSIDYLHEELIKTLHGMQPGSYFYVSFFDDFALPMPGANTWVPGGRDLTQLMNWIRSVGPGGGTNPLPSFQRAFALDPRPDVIFFMTDGQFPDSASQIAQLNNQGPKRAIIHTIQFDNSGIQGAGFGGSGNRYGLLLSTYQLPENVKQRLSMVSAGSGGFSPDTQLEEIARQSGGTFTVFGRSAPQKITNNTLLIPVLAGVDQITSADPLYPHRSGSRYKAYTVLLQAGKTYQIDMVGGFDTYLFLENATGQVLSRNDDAVGLNSLITFSPPVTGTYRIIASTFGGGTGPFALTVIDRPL